MSVYTLDGVGPTIDESVWIAPNASVIGDVYLAQNASIWFGVVIRCDNEPIRIGANTNVQDNSVLHSDPGKPLVIGEGVTVGHKAMLHGCTVGDNTLIGIGATVLNGAVIGNNCIIGAHALITEDKIIPDGSLVVGSPGVVKKQLGPGAIAMLKMSALHYVENARRFQSGLKSI
ncbi:MAG TPA: gamma carbonic anhydrase family protein [Hellea balneolensis]|uniref:Gamma carbonic anhydrase family protein n=1 Tax=Hellea balneolensis TaxID=287478 RepID=A0A7C5R085_9PROT|nr:gamma carbonic anhydrase family protein [Hellea balneolensis]